MSWSYILTDSIIVQNGNVNVPAGGSANTNSFTPSATAIAYVNIDLPSGVSANIVIGSLSFPLTQGFSMWVVPAGAKVYISISNLTSSAVDVPVILVLAGL